MPIRSTIEALEILKELEPVLQSFEVIKGSMDDVFIRINEEGELPYVNDAKLSEQTLKSI